ncbi:MAG: hypothetical protein ACQCN6_10085 [Candidatus Bathyarchaeia archaeon]|jgi:hypothetical protein
MRHIRKRLDIQIIPNHWEDGHDNIGIDCTTQEVMTIEGKWKASQPLIERTIVGILSHETIEYMLFNERNSIHYLLGSRQTTKDYEGQNHGLVFSKRRLREIANSKWASFLSEDEKPAPQKSQGTPDSFRTQTASPMPQNSEAQPDKTRSKRIFTAQPKKGTANTDFTEPFAPLYKGRGSVAEQQTVFHLKPALFVEVATTSQQPEPDAETKKQSEVQPAGCCCV